MQTSRRQLLQGVGAALTALPLAGQSAAGGERPVLWYKAPAKEWTQALPVGNGNLGAMVFGGIEQERLQLNEHSLWSGHAVEIDSPHTLEVLPQVRQLLFDGKYMEAQQLASREMMVRTRVPRRRTRRWATSRSHSITAPKPSSTAASWTSTRQSRGRNTAPAASGSRARSSLRNPTRRS